jgi:hypothetical protein
MLLSQGKKPSKVKAGTQLRVNATRGSLVRQDQEGVWRLEVPSGSSGSYRLAQLDDYGSRPRRNFPWRAPFALSLQARASSAKIPGTWGFGLWNNPFGMAILRGAELLRLPALPNAAWFFFASPENYLSLRDDLPASGLMASTFRSPGLPFPLFLPAAPALPLVLLPPAARLIRRIGRRLVRQDGASPQVDVTGWHSYEIEWREDRTTFKIDEQSVLETPVAPLEPLGLVLWVDNQYAAFTSEGRVSFGTLGNPEPAWIELREILVA